REPILPFDLLRNRTVAASIVCVGLVGMAMLGTIAFVPLFVQGVIGTSATSSGVVLTPFMLGAVTTSIVSGQLVSRIGRYRPNTLIGPIVLGIGMLLLWRMDVHTTNGQAARNMVVAGVGLGMMMQMFVLSVQNSVPSAAMGSATALTQFSRQIGATLGVTIMGVIVNQGLPRARRAGACAGGNAHGRHSGARPSTASEPRLPATTGPIARRARRAPRRSGNAGGPRGRPQPPRRGRLRPRARPPPSWPRRPSGRAARHRSHRRTGRRPRRPGSAG